MRKALLAIMVVLVFPAAADARPFNAQEMRMVELAHDYWGKGPACDRITYTVMSRSELGASGGWGACQMVLADDMVWIARCTTIAHEWGHALQNDVDLPNDGHYGQLGDLMSESPDPTPQCLRADDLRIYRHHKARCKSKASRVKCLRRARRLAFG